MRILFVCNEFSVLSQTFVYDRVCGLSARGHDVHVATIKRAMQTERPYEKVLPLRKAGVFDRSWRKLAASGVIHTAACYVGWKFRRKTHLEVRYEQSLDEAVVAVNPDLIHAEFGQMGVLANHVALRRSKPLIVFMHGYDITQVPRNNRWRDAYKGLWRQGVTIMTPSEFMRQKVIALGASADQVVVQHNGLELQTWTYSDPSSRYTGKVSYLFVGRLVDKKGPLQLIKAFSLLRQKAPDLDAELTLCGTGPLEAILHEEIEKLQLADAVHLLGACSNEEVRQQMARAHIMVQHSVTARSGDMEGLPVSLTEAAASGLPIIATRHSGIPEIVQDGVNGFLVEENDVEAMAERMIELGRSPEFWAVLGWKGRMMVEKLFERDGVLQLYEETVDNVDSRSIFF